RSMMEAFGEEYGATVRHAWGMTEMSPLGTINTPLGKHSKLSKKELYDLAEGQGRALYGVQMKIVDDEGKELPRDGKAFGELLVRGPWVSSGYYGLDRSAAHER